MIHDWRYQRDEEFRARVVRQAIMLGFEAVEYEVPKAPWSGASDPDVKAKRWKFKAPGGGYASGYASVYYAALEFLRLSKYPQHLIGRTNDGGQVSDA